MKINENVKMKNVRSESYNYVFNKESGFFARWGKTMDSNPEFSPFGPEIADIEISTVCNMGCDYCYKSNTSSGSNMSFETLQKVITTINPNNVLTQVAFGLGATAEENPDLWKMCDWLRSVGIIPNGTVANISDETADKISSKFGACAVSYHGNKDICYNSIKRLTDRGLKQTNMHFVIYEENFEETLDVLHDIQKDSRLKLLNAIVFLSLKKKGRAEGNVFNTLSQDKFSKIVDYCFDRKIPFGFDSCSAHKFMKAIENNKDKEKLIEVVEPCESGLFSLYSNVEGKYFPCSFSEYGEGVDLTNCNNFLEMWNKNSFRNKLISNNRNCPIYNI